MTSSLRWLLPAGTLGAAAGLVFGTAGLLVLPYHVPSVCAGVACDAVGVNVVLPNFDRVEVQLRGPAPGVWYARAGSPSNVVAR